MSDEHSMTATRRSVYDVLLWVPSGDGTGHSEKYRVIADSAEHAARAKLPGQNGNKAQVRSVSLSDDAVYELPESGRL